MNRKHIIQTAKDYDLPVWLVEKTIEMYPNTYYDKLDDILNGGDGL